MTNRRRNPLDLRRAEMREAYLEQANLVADFRGADISCCSAQGADLTRSDLSHVTARGANLRNAVLNINAVGADFREADLTGAIIDGDWSYADLRGADLRNAVLMPGLRWDGIWLSGATIRLDALQADTGLLQHALAEGARILWESEPPAGTPDTSDLPF